MPVAAAAFMMTDGLTDATWLDSLATVVKLPLLLLLRHFAAAAATASVRRAGMPPGALALALADRGHVAVFDAQCSLVSTYAFSCTLSQKRKVMKKN